MDKGPLPPRQQRRLPVYGLRMQLLLWLALPITLLVLVILLVEVNSHERAMQRLVQARADSLVTATAALIGARVDHAQDVLAQLARSLPAEATTNELSLPLFSSGLARYRVNGEPISTSSTGSWQAVPQLRTLVRRVAGVNAPSFVTLLDEQTQQWLLVLAAPIKTSASLDVLVGATPVRRLLLENLFEPLAPGADAEFHLEDADGGTLIELLDAHQTLASATHVVTAQATVPTTGWRVVLHESWAGLVPTVLRLDVAVFAVVGLAVVASLLAAYFGLRNILQPLAQLNAAAQRIGQGAYEAIQQPVGGVAEIEQLRLALVQMAEQVRQYQQQLHQYIDAMTLGQEEERKRLARELHDETVQALIALKQQVELTAREWERQPERASVRLRDLQPMVAETITGLRQQIHNLRPPYLEDLGFVPALEALIKQTAQQHALIGDFEVSGQPQRRLAPSVELSAYRIVQEAVHNVAEHAQAHWVHVELIFDPAGITLRIEDDGVGFTLPPQLYTLAQSGHYGLLGIQERAQLHGGHLHIETAIDQGTTVSTWLAVPAAQL